MKDIQLFINNQEVEFSQTPDILFTFQADELTNPTIVKNSYSKTITIDGTPKNNAIFDGIWDVERVQDILTFNPSKKAPFTLYHNGDVYQTGYAKLIDVNRDGNHITYNLGMYGGLGDFFYSLMYSQSDDVGESDKRKLSDLYYGTNATATTSADEFDFQINKGTVQEAWSQLTASTTGSMWNTINFAPCYNGLPDDFDADKVLINTLGMTDIKKTFTSGGTTYGAYNNHVLAELPNEYTEWEMRDIRSYLQRPILRVKDTIQAICNPSNNGGYEVELDTESFFNSGNPYYEKAWMTLPMLSSMDFDNTKEAVSGTASLGASEQEYLSRLYYTQKEEIRVSGTPEEASSYNLSVDIDIQALIDSAWTSGLVTGSTSTAETNTLEITSYASNDSIEYPSAIEVQLVAYDQNGRVCGGSDNIHITNVYQRRSSGGSGGGRSGRRPSTSTDVIPSMSDLNFTPVYSGAQSTQLLTYFDYVGNNKRTWQLHSGVSLTIKNVKKGWIVKLVMTKVTTYLSGFGHNYDSRYLFQPYYSNSGVKYHRVTLMDRFNVILNGAQVTFNTNEAIRSGSRIKKANLLNTSYTPADFLLSYCKLFGLYFSKDTVENKIYIRTRKNFFDGNTVKDLDLLIDRNKQSTIKPILFDAKWYNFQLEQEDAYFANIYKDTYGIEYGVQKVNTGYNFDGNDNNLLKDNLFKSAVECEERSNMYTYYSGDTQEKPWMYQGYTYQLYSNTNYEESTEMNVSATTRINKLKLFQSLKYYDLFSKVQLHGDNNDPSDGSCILVFFDTFVPTKSKANGDDIKYWLTDDCNEMSVLNEDTPCWYYTVAANANAVQLTSIPHFGRYLINDATNTITSSWDFGEPKQLYIPDAHTSARSTIYNQFWKKYISDLYDIDTRKLTCYVNFKGIPTEEWLRYFYWFDNGIWRINKIIDHNVASNDTTKVEFIKVQSISDYTSTDWEVPYTISIDFGSSSYETLVPNSGGSVTVHVNVSDNSSDWYVNTDIIPYASVTSGHGDGSFTITLPANTAYNSQVIYVALQTDYDGWSNTITLTQGNSILTGEFQQPHKSRNIYASGETAALTIKSTYPWTITKDRDFVTLSSTSGTGNPTVGETINVTWDASDSLAFRSTKFTITDSKGNKIYVFKNQNGIESTKLIYSYTGGTKTLSYESGKETIVPDWLTITDNGDNTYNLVAIENRTALAKSATLAFQGDDAVSLYYVNVEQEASETPSPTGWTRAVDITPKVWSYSENGGSQTLTITNPSGNTWEFHNLPNWVTVNSLSGTIEGNIYAIAASSVTVNDRSGIIVFYDRTEDETITLYCKQAGLPRVTTAITLDNLTWVVDIPASGGTANASNCSYSVTAYFDDGTSEDITQLASVIGSLSVSSSMTESRHSAGTLTITASYGGLSDSGSVVVYQSAYVPYITGITISGLTWTTDVPYSGGTADSGNCSYYVNAYYDNGRIDNITNHVNMSGSTYVEFSNISERHSAGTLTLSTSYSGFTASGSVTIYQTAAEPYIFISPAIYNFGQNGGYVELIVNSNVDFDITVTGDTGPITVTGIQLTDLTWVNDIPSSGGTATSANCTYTVNALLSNGITSDITDISTVSGSLVVSETTATTRENVGILTLTASYSGFSGSNTVNVYQEGVQVYLTGITLSGLTWVNDVPSSGGIASSANCSYSVIGSLSDGSTADITSLATISGTLAVTATTASTRENVGTLTLTASYSGFTDSDSVAVYQEANSSPSGATEYFTLDIVSGGSIYFIKNTSLPIGTKTIDYCKNNGSWVTLESDTTPISVSAGDKVKLRGTNTSYSAYTICSNDAYYNLEGNIMSLVYGDNFSGQTALETTRTFQGTFSGYNGYSGHVVSAENLVLPATSLTDYCYANMFKNNTSMTKAPTLPAKTLSANCYRQMFNGCSSLNSMKCLATNNSASNCTYNWLNGVASSGTFVKDSSMTSWGSGVSGIPNNWSIIDI